MIKSKLKILSIGLILTITLTGCRIYAFNLKNPVSTKTSLELQVMQRRTFNSSYKIVFASVLSVLLDKGYIIDTADVLTKYITATSTKKREKIALDGVRLSYTQVTAYIEPIQTKQIDVRLNFVEHQELTMEFAAPASNSIPIEEPKFYQEVFNRIYKEVFIRVNR